MENKKKLKTRLKITKKKYF